MRSAFISSLRAADLTPKILLTLGIIILYQVGAALPSPGVNYPNMLQCIKAAGGGETGQINSLIKMTSGDAYLRLSVLAMGVMPYITATIIVHLLTVVIRRFKNLRKEGQSGQANLTQYIRYLTIVLATLQATCAVALAASGGLWQGCSLDIIADPSIFTLVVIVLVMTAGAALAMWMSEVITERGIGNGMQLLFFVGIAEDEILDKGKSLLDTHSEMMFAAVCVTAVIIIVAVAFVGQGQRRIPVQYTVPMVGRRMFGYVSLKVSPAGILPVIFANSLILIPRLITQLIRSGSGGVGNSWWDKIVNDEFGPGNPVYIGIYVGLIIFLTYFYASITFKPDELADEMKKFGRFIPGVQPGRPTADYLRYVRNRTTLPGSIFLGVIAVLPTGGYANLPLVGTTVLILVGALSDIRENSAQARGLIAVVRRLLDGEVEVKPTEKALLQARSTTAIKRAF